MAIISWQIEHIPQVGSTNLVLRERARAGAPAGLVVHTDEQTSGRGRLGRGWIAPPGSSLLTSILLRPDLPADSAYLITMAAAVALCAAVERLAGIPAVLKWPNDLLLIAPNRQQRKAAGILSEAEISNGRLSWVIIGIGVNLTWHPTGVVDGRDLAASATSVQAAGGPALAPAALLAVLLNELDQRLAQITTPALLLDAWRSRLITIGQRVTVQLPDRTVSGMAEGVEASGALLVRDENGALHTLHAGDVGA